MYNNYDYPCGTDSPNAPWNQVDNPEREIDVTVSVTLSKTKKLKYLTMRLLTLERMKMVNILRI